VFKKKIGRVRNCFSFRFHGLEIIKKYVNVRMGRVLGSRKERWLILFVIAAFRPRKHLPLAACMYVFWLGYFVVLVAADSCISRAEMRSNFIIIPNTTLCFFLHRWIKFLRELLNWDATGGKRNNKSEWAKEMKNLSRNNLLN